MRTRHRDRLLELWNYYKIGVINTLFGFGAYMVLVYVGLNLFLAQICAQMLGVTFNYFTYSRHVFRNSRTNIIAFIGAYVLNYLIGLGFLFVAHQFFASPYIAGLIGAICSSIINYFLLKAFVFKSKEV